MPVKLSVQDVRKQIFRVAGGTADGSGPGSSNLLLGRMFHESFARMFGEEEQALWRPSVAVHGNEREWQKHLENWLYSRIIGPRLVRERVHLNHAAEETVAFWNASTQMCAWTAGLLWEDWQKRTQDTMSDIGLLISPEEPLSCEIAENGWTDSVILTGVADLVLTLPGKPIWCVVELKLGRGCAEADVAQACLYHQILSIENRDSPGAMALVSFKPEREEIIFSQDELKKAKNPLFELMGRMAGVLPGSSPRIKRPDATKPGTPNTETEDLGKFAEQGEKITSIFREYGKEIAIDGDPVPGPAFIRYPIRLGKGVRLTAAQTTAKEVQHRLRLQAPPYVHISGGGVVLDIQRPDRKTVCFSSIRNQLPTSHTKTGSAKILLGVDLDNTLRFADLSEPDNVHILAAGTTASGKSEWLRSVLAGLMLANTPETLRLVLVDPKRNAFNEMRGSPFMMSPDALIYPDERPPADVLSRLADEMDRRYITLQQAGADTRDAFVEKTGRTMPRIVCVCDEYYDLINRDRNERRDVESQIFRLGAKARAAGIHLVIATQHPSRQTIKGALDANIPARVGFKMSRDIESNMLLNRKGAENLLGKGDLLFRDIGEPVRLQSPLLSAQERMDIFGKTV